MPLEHRAKIGIVGTRRRDSVEDYRAIRKVFQRVYQPGDIIVSGGCPKGGDRMAELLAISIARVRIGQSATTEWLFKLGANQRRELIRKLDAPIRIYYPNWKRYGKGAGLRRNAMIAKDSDVLIACVAPDRRGGTEDTISHFRALHAESSLLLI